MKKIALGFVAGLIFATAGLQLLQAPAYSHPRPAGYSEWACYADSAYGRMRCMPFQMAIERIAESLGDNGVEI